MMFRLASCALAIVYCIVSRPAYSNFEYGEVPPPFAFSLFCARYLEDCQHHSDRRITNFLSTPQRWRELNQTNSTVNYGIAPKSQSESRRDYDWQIFPHDGNCADYAVTKRHLLLQLGWPSAALLLAEVIVRATGEPHLVLLVKEGHAVYVLDNLDPLVTRLNEAPDRYVVTRTESDRYPQLWNRLLASRSISSQDQGSWFRRSGSTIEVGPR